MTTNHAEEIRTLRAFLARFFYGSVLEELPGEELPVVFLDIKGFFGSQFELSDCSKVMDLLLEDDDPGL